MNKQEFLDQLKARLSDLPSKDIEDRLGFYNEMIEDRVEEGITEEEAIREIGSVEKLASQIMEEIALSKNVKKQRKHHRKLKAWEIVLLALGSPIWISLLIAAVAVILSLYVVIWALVASVWAVFASLTACAPVGFAMGIDFILVGNAITGIAMLGTALVCAGLSIFMFFGCKAITQGIILLTKKIFLAIQNYFKAEKEDHHE